MVTPLPDFSPGAVCHGRMTAQQSKDRCVRATNNEVAALLASREFEHWLDGKRSSTALAWRVAFILALLLAATSATSVQFYGQIHGMHDELVQMEEDSNKLLLQLSTVPCVPTPTPNSGAAFEGTSCLPENVDQNEGQDDMHRSDSIYGSEGVDHEVDTITSGGFGQQPPRGGDSAEAGVDHQLGTAVLLAEVQLRDDKIVALENQVKEKEMDAAAVERRSQAYKGTAVWATCVVVVIAVNIFAGYWKQVQELKDTKEKLQLEKNRVHSAAEKAKGVQTLRGKEEQIAQLQEETRAMEVMSQRLEVEAKQHQAMQEKVAAVAAENEALERQIEPFKGLLRQNAEMKEKMGKFALLEKENLELNDVAKHLATAQEKNSELKALKELLNQVKEQNNNLEKTTLQLPPEERRLEILNEKVARLDELKKQRELLEPKAQCLDSVEKEHKQLLAVTARVVELQDKVKKLPALEQEERDLMAKSMEVDEVVARIEEVSGKSDILSLVRDAYNTAKSDAENVDHLLVELGAKHEDIANKVKRVQELQTKLGELEDEGNKLAKIEEEVMEKMTRLQAVQKELEPLRAQVQGLPALQQEKKELQAKASEMDNFNKETQRLSEVVKDLELVKEKHAQLKTQAAEVEALQAENAKLEEGLAAGTQAIGEKKDADHSTASREECAEGPAQSSLESDCSGTDRNRGENATSSWVGNMQQTTMPQNANARNSAVNEPGQPSPNGEVVESSGDATSTPAMHDRVLGSVEPPGVLGGNPPGLAAVAQLDKSSSETYGNT